MGLIWNSPDIIAVMPKTTANKPPPLAATITSTVSPGTIVYRKGAVADTVVRDPSTTERTLASIVFSSSPAMTIALSTGASRS